jgi:hypothetical protein
MRYIVILESIKIKEQSDPITFNTMIENWTNDNKFGALGLAGTKMSIAIHSRFAKAKVGDEVPLEDREWTQLCDVVNNPTGGYVTSVARQLIPFCDAVIEAPTTARKTANGSSVSEEKRP